MKGSGVQPVVSTFNIKYAEATAAGNSSITLRGVSDRRIKIISYRMKLVADATIVNRNLKQIYRIQASTVFETSVQGANITAGNTGYMSMSAITAVGGGVTRPDDADYFVCPNGLWLLNGNNTELVLYAVAGVVGDVLSVAYLYEDYPA